MIVLRGHFSIDVLFGYLMAYNFYDKAKGVEDFFIKYCGLKVEEVEEKTEEKEKALKELF
eukprot:CAMPEP_0170529408 /NCGR_PEP_ID=MMETSP0209-20121228/21492_1 /TAXON_ID=665100 ORGANISM="Litonotus pictus, Strain P1" /NCGR_SAMPLE_ID=MMETSP0209 /ASSEMBLY_ACC=CAM_ASM_000301 /LENGTH=59 /DNA_ID=CAMNT_0010821337 /DNA_START=767 /DNA_END=946 /DNA_ORIENTATION=-